MKKTALILVACILMLPFAGYAEDLYQAKCVSCHGADGKKNAKKDLTSDDVQKKTDDELVTFLTTNGIHKSKIANADDAKAVVKFLRTLKK